MIQLPERNLSNQTMNFLKNRQAEVDVVTNFTDRTAQARKLFQSKSNRHFEEIKNVLTEMCNGNKRCNYCEDNQANEIEHIRPLSLYPESAFQWLNYCYVCGICNPRKNNKYAYILEFEGQPQIIKAETDNKGIGPDAFIHPRMENPFAFIKLEIENTFRFLPLPGLSKQEKLKGEYTINILDLNRNVLIDARQAAYQDLVCRLESYQSKKEKDPYDPKLEVIKSQILRTNHITVWCEMQRQRDFIPDLKELFTSLPEALNW